MPYQQRREVYMVSIDLQAVCRKSVQRTQSHMKKEVFEIDSIYVPAKRRKTLNPELANSLAESMLEIGQSTPILVRADGDRYVLIEGLHRLEACRSLGETTVEGYVVQARKF